MILTCAFDDLEPHRGAARALDHDELDAVCVTDVYPADVLGELAERLDAPRWRALRSPRDHLRDAPQVEVLGEPVSPSMLHPSGPALDDYLAAAPRFARDLLELFAPNESFSARARSILGVLFDVEVALPAAAGHPYGEATIRRVPPGCGLDVHRENLYQHIAVYDPIRDTLDLGGVASVFLLISAPDEGGELRLFGSRSPGFEPPHAVVAPGPGTLVVFSGGRRFHDVAPVSGGRPRWTVGGFFARAQSERAGYFWG